MSNADPSPVASLAPVCADYAAVTDVRAADPGAVTAPGTPGRHARPSGVTAG